MDKFIIELSNLSFSYAQINALNQINLNVQPGVFGLLGPNGAGKTTLMKILLGFLKPSSGSAKVLGLELASDIKPIRQQIGYMPESDSMIPNTDAVNLTAYMGALAGMPWHEAVKRAHEVLYYVGLEDSRYRQVNTYSTGMKQRLKLATALVHDPKLLFLDEPTSGMDPGARGDMLALIKDIAKKGQMNILLSSHILADIESTCQQVFIMNRGELVAEKKVGQESQATGEIYRIRLQGRIEDLSADVQTHLTQLDHPETHQLRLDHLLSKGQFFKHLIDRGIQLREFVPEIETLANTFEAVIGENHEH
jgi:ABC-2 type transport system ATP-binding protein